MSNKRGATTIDSEMLVYIVIGVIILALLIAAVMFFGNADSNLLGYIKRLFTFG